MQRLLFILMALFFCSSLLAQSKCIVSQPFVIINKQTPGNLPVDDDGVIIASTPQYLMSIFFNSTCDTMPVLKKLRINNKPFNAAIEKIALDEPIAVNENETPVWLKKKEGRFYYKIIVLLTEADVKKQRIPQLYLLQQQSKWLYKRVSKNWSVVQATPTY